QVSRWPTAKFIPDKRQILNLPAGNLLPSDMFKRTPSCSSTVFLHSLAPAKKNYLRTLLHSTQRRVLY
ncbi:MAG TPA: hypothetical protein IAA30_01510, partial [Candidatus Treponema faecavium]|nr:hypothetical protein [Candidatus Treponema faecavium]